jgi:NADPH:quinone reductase-like Zn-dependent oxidoreductase
MKAVRLNELGGPQHLHIEDVATPAPGAGEILIRVKRAAFNRRDVFITQNLYPGIVLPRTLGSDGCGEVAALGIGVSAPPVGTPVVINPEMGWVADGPIPDGGGSVILGMPSDGTFAQYVVVPAANVFHKPSPLTDDEAAAIPLAGLTAYRATFTRGRISKDDVVFIPGVGSGVQTFVLLYAKHVGAHTIVTSGTDEKVARAKELGADVAINYKSDPDWHKTVRKASGGGPTLCVDSTGGETFSKSLDILRPGGRIVVYGGTQGDAKVRPFSIFWKHVDILGTSMGSPSDFASMLKLFEAGLRPVVDRTFAMSDVVAAAERVLAGEQFGKVVLAID